MQKAYHQSIASFQPKKRKWSKLFSGLAPKRISAMATVNDQKR